MSDSHSKSLQVTFEVIGGAKSRSLHQFRRLRLRKSKMADGAEQKTDINLHYGFVGGCGGNAI